MRSGIASFSSIVVSSGTTSERTNCLTARTMSCKSSCSIAHLLTNCIRRARERLAYRGAPPQQRCRAVAGLAEFLAQRVEDPEQIWEPGDARPFDRSAGMVDSEL